MSEMPDIYNTDFSKDKNAAKAMIDFAVDTWQSRTYKRNKMSKREQHYNGEYDNETIGYIKQSTGKISKTKFIPFHIARNKMNLLLGEYRRLPLNFSIHVVDPESKNSKLEEYEKMYGLSLAKEQVEELRGMGFNIFEGVDIPSKNDKKFWNPENFKTKNEKIMNTILKIKIPNIHLKLKLSDNFEDLNLHNEEHGRIYKNGDGIVDYETIPPEDAIYLTNKNDHFCMNSPFKGHRKRMFYGEIIKEYGLDKDKAKKLRTITDTGSDIYDNDAICEINSTGVIYNVFIIQWFARRKMVEKIVTLKDGITQRKIISAEYWNKNSKKIKRGAEKGLYKLRMYDDWTVYEGVRVGKNFYIKIDEKTENIKRQYNSNQWVVHMDYINGIKDVKTDKSLSKYDIMMDIGEVYDNVRFNINREIGSFIGNAYGIDEAFMTKGKNVTDIVHEVKEDKLLIINSSADGNVSGMDGIPGQFPIKELKLGDNTILNTLINVAMDLERLMDRITGINESRQGLEMATQTATANQNNLQASRSQTYDLFDFQNEYVKIVLEMLAEKTKLNWAELSNGGYDKVMSDKNYMFLKVTKDIMSKSYGAIVIDSLKEEQTKREMFQIFLNEVNAGSIHSAEVAQFNMANTLVDAIDVLENVKERVEKREKEMMQIQSQNKQEELITKQKIKDNEREDKQQHDKDMAILQGQLDQALQKMKSLETANKTTQETQTSIKQELLKQQMAE